MKTDSLSLLDAVKTAVRKLEETSADGQPWELYVKARAEADALRRTISDEMDALLYSGMDDRGDLLAKYRNLRKFHEMLGR